MESKFIEIFTGLKRNYGYCNVKNGYKEDIGNGKVKFKPGDYGWSQNPIKEQDYIEHLEGKKSIGIQPCDDEGMARFGAIDIDPEDYQEFNIKKYLDIINDKNIPVIPVKSKSGGLHVYMFLKEPAKASFIRNFLDKLLFTFKLESNTEIFPKQTELGTSDEGNPINGNFINLPYYKKNERVAVNPTDGTEFTFEQFIKIVEANTKTAAELEEFANTLVNKELTGGDEEFIDGPPCLQALSKNKLNDGRDRFLYNYMVFSKKKYPDDWEKKVVEAARKYFEYSSEWDDNKVNFKIRAWRKETKGHTCNEDPIKSNCIKSVCVKRKFGIASDKRKTWPMLSNLVKIDYPLEPEFWLTVHLPDKGEGEKTKQITARNIDKVLEMRDLRKVVAAQTPIVPPKIKDADFQIIIDSLWDNMEIIKPASGTTPEEQLHKHLTDYIHQMPATSHASFQSGATLISDGNAYFIFDHFFNFLKNKEWKTKEDRTATQMQTQFKADFTCRKRFPKKEAEKKSNPPVKCVKIEDSYFIKEESPDELIPMQDQGDIL